MGANASGVVRLEGDSRISLISDARPRNGRNRRTGAIRQATGQGTPSTCQETAPANTENGRDRERPEHQRALAGFCRQEQPRVPFPSRGILGSPRRLTNRGRETMRDDPWTVANREKEQQKVTIPPKRKPTAETASPPSKPTVSGPFWTREKICIRCPKASRDRRRTTTNR
jgi:hypothetical protein